MTAGIAIRVDGRPCVVPAPCTLAALLARLGRVDDAVATALNGDFVPRPERASRELAEGDDVTCIQLIVGG